MATKYIFVTGGVVSSLGKGTTAASLGRLLKDRGYSVSMQKFDPYINISPGTMSPYQHGEVFVTDDGGECDLDVGHYERFIDENLNIDSDITSGGIYESVIANERNGDYHGSTVQVIPHITNEIKRRIYKLGNGGTHPDFVITEVGGTVGDIESLPFLEAIRQIKWEVGVEHCMYIHVTLVPYLNRSGELKTKPTQHSVKELRSIGIQPDIIVLRSEMPISRTLRDKVGLFCNIKGDAVIPNIDTEFIYEIPLLLEKDGLGKLVCRKFGLNEDVPAHEEWIHIVQRLRHPEHKVQIALVGKYTELHDAYISVTEALTHAGILYNTEIEIVWVNAQDLEAMDHVSSMFADVDAIIIPSGFGKRGTEGKIRAAKYARENNIPLLAIGMGMQMAVVEIANNVCQLDADSAERATGKHPVIDLMTGSKPEGNTMRVGKYACIIKEGTLAHSVYGATEIEERHRHRYEVNNAYLSILESHGLVCSGINPESGLVEIVELPGHRWYMGVQFNAEFKSRPNRPHPLYSSFVHAALEYSFKR